MTGQQFTAGNENLVEAKLNTIITALSNAGILRSTGTAVIPAVSGVDFMRAHWVNVLDHGADPTGVADSTAAFTAAIAALPSSGGWVYAPTGVYKITSTLSLAQFQGIRGDGMGVTTINYTGTGPCISATFTLNGGSPTGLPTPCAFEGFTVDGTSAGTGAIGLQIGNLFNSRGHDLCFQNFATTGGAGICFKNYGSLPVVNNMDWTRVSLRYNTTGVLFDGGVSAGSSQGDFSYSNFQFSTICRTNQSGVTLQNGASVGGGRFALRGTFSSASSTNTGWVIGVDPAGSNIRASAITEMEFDVIVEYDGALLGHKTLVMGGTLSTAAFTGNGKLEFGNAPGYSFQHAVVPLGNLFAFEGRLQEPSLAAMTYNDCAVYQGGTQRNVWNNSGAQIPTSFTVFPQLGDVQSWKLQSGVTTVTFNGTPYLASRTLDIRIAQPASGAAGTITWPSNVVWVNGYNTLSATNGAVDRVRMTYFPAVDTWYAHLLGGSAKTASALASGAALGTPASGTLTNCTGLPLSGLSAPSGIPSTLLPNGILNANSALQFVTAVAATNIYITNSQLALPATYLQGMLAPSGSGGTVKAGTIFRWRLSLTKNANGTGSFTFLIFRGVNGTTADTADVSQAMGTMTAVNDTLVMDVQVTVVTTGATGSYYWSINMVHSAAAATGFGVATSAGAPSTLNGTVTGVAMNTASLVFGLGVVCGAGGTMPNISVPMVEAQAFNID